ncbi:SDR family NAD(P)-dependent oxidoreductase [Corynebacterium glyciniphilum]|uniref:SDR family NAD(P)-dependent oxidoreductase n=1 Tax=Corynebacterium glyciniphilum TaxID=1404244 RepID=UPI0011AB7077|nr:SDR family NAD(P)-dependent oxidoreductase [Corynebacterium glyciniphilum]
MARIFVTGASLGLGLRTATSLAEGGHEVVLHARSADRIGGPTVLQQMHGHVYGDLADLEQVRSVAGQADRYGAFDAVIHNAGVIGGPDLTAVNVIAPYALSALLQRPARSIVLSSSMHYSGSLDGATTAIAGRRDTSYSDTKLWVTALFHGIALRWPDVLVHAVDPGWVPTRMGGPSASDDLTEGHRTQEWLATAAADDIVPHSGGYWRHFVAGDPHPAVHDELFHDELIGALEEHTGLSLP